MSTSSGYDWDSMRAYTIIGFVAATMVFGAADWIMADRILDGHIAVDLTSPSTSSGPAPPSTSDRCSRRSRPP